MALSSNQTARAKPALMGIVLLKTVEQGRNIEEDLRLDKPMSVLCGDFDQLAAFGHDIIKNIDIVADPERDYYLFRVAYDGVEYTYAPGDALLVYADGSLKGIVGQSVDDLKRIWGVLHANVA